MNASRQFRVLSRTIALMLILGNELYDVINDPRELNNLAILTQFATTKAKLHALLLELDHTTQTASAKN